MKSPNLQIIRKRTIVVISLLFIVIQLNAQSDSLAKLAQFLYPEFSIGVVKLKSGEIHTVKMNYNTISEKMVFYQNGTLMDLDKPEIVDNIVLQNAKFVSIENVFYEVLVNAPIALYIQHKSDLTSSEKPAGYGSSSQTAASTPISELHNDKAYNLKLPENFKVIPAPVFWVRMNGVMYKFASERQFLKIFPAEVAKLKKFINQNNLNIKRQDDLIKLVTYCNELI